MTIFRWLGQACFIITTAMGSHLLIDPPNPSIGYKIAAHSIKANAVFVSHNHPDHNWVQAAAGAPPVVQPLTSETSDNGKLINGQGDFKYERIFAYHDNVQGAQRGVDTISVFQTGGLRIVHMGDIGELALTPQQVKEIGRVDVLMIPVGGFFTVDAGQAAALVQQLNPRVIIPMHYGTPALSADLQSKLAPATGFLVAMSGKANVVTVHPRDLKLSPKTLPKKTTIYVLRYE